VVGKSIESYFSFFGENIILIKINFRNIFAFGLYSAFFQYFYPCSREFRSALTLLFAFWLGCCSCLLQKYFNKLCSHKIKPKIAYNNGGEVSSWQDGTIHIVWYCDLLGGVRHMLWARPWPFQLFVFGPSCGWRLR